MNGAGADVVWGDGVNSFWFPMGERASQITCCCYCAASLASLCVALLAANANPLSCDEGEESPCCQPCCIILVMMIGMSGFLVMMIGINVILCERVFPVHREWKPAVYLASVCFAGVLTILAVYFLVGILAPCRCLEFSQQDLNPRQQNLGLQQNLSLQQNRQNLSSSRGAGRGRRAPARGRWGGFWGRLVKTRRGRLERPL